MGLSMLGTRYILSVRAIFILFQFYFQSRLKINILVDLSL